MPKITMSFPSEDAIPAELKAYKMADSNVVEVWAGDKVAEETNQSLAANRDTILREKTTLKTEFDTFKAAQNDVNREVIDLREKIAKGGQVSTEELALLNSVKQFGDAKTVSEKLTNYDVLAADVPKLKQELAVEKVSRVGQINPAVLNMALSNTPDAEVFVENVKDKDGKDVPTPFIKRGEEKTEIRKFAETDSNWQPLIPSLFTDQKGGGFNYLREQGSGGNGGGNPADDAVAAAIAKQADANKNAPDPFKKPPIVAAA